MIEDALKNDVEKCNFWRGFGKWCRSALGASVEKKNGSELKLHLFRGKMEYKQVFKYVEEHVRFVYQALFYLSYVIHAPT